MKDLYPHELLALLLVDTSCDDDDDDGRRTWRPWHHVYSFITCKMMPKYSDDDPSTECVDATM